MARNIGVRAANVDALTEFNRSKVIQAIYRRGVCSRAQIARAVGMTSAGITKIIAQLLELGIVVEDGELRGLGGRRSIAVRLNADRYRVIGVKFGRGRTEIGVFTLMGTFVRKESDGYVYWDVPLDADVDDMVRRVKDWIRVRVERDPAIAAIGVAVPGPYLKHDGHAVLVTNMESWARVNFREEFCDVFAVPAFVEQDARAGVLAQWLLSPGNGGVDNMAYFMLGEGVGVGVLDHGACVDGARGLASEIGHVSIDVNGKPCECHNRGCLERYTSIDGMIELAAQMHPDLLTSAGGVNRREMCDHIFSGARNGDAACVEVVKQLGRYVGYGCLIIMNAYDPERIVIGDFMSHGGVMLLDEVNRVVRERSIPGGAKATAIVFNDLDNDSVLLGAAAVATEELLHDPKLFAVSGAKSAVA